MSNSIPGMFYSSETASTDSTTTITAVVQDVETMRCKHVQKQKLVGGFAILVHFGAEN